MLCQLCQKPSLPLIAPPDYHPQQKKSNKKAKKKAVSGIVANAQQIVFFFGLLCHLQLKGFCSLYTSWNQQYLALLIPKPHSLPFTFSSSLRCGLTLIYSSAQSLGRFPTLPDNVHM